MDDGVLVKPTPITAGENVKITYNGLLAKAGADEVYLHAGFGLRNVWDNVKDLKMENKNGNWSTDMDIDTDKRFYFCFYDSAGNWDNNNGLNWSFEVHNGELY